MLQFRRAGNLAISARVCRPWILNPISGITMTIERHHVALLLLFQLSDDERHRPSAQYVYEHVLLIFVVHGMDVPRQSMRSSYALMMNDDVGNVKCQSQVPFLPHPLASMESLFCSCIGNYLRGNMMTGGG